VTEYRDGIPPARRIPPACIHVSDRAAARARARPIITSPHSAKLGSFSSAISAARMCIHGSTGIASLKDRNRHVCAYDCLPADYRRDISRFAASLSLSLSLSLVSFSFSLPAIVALCTECERGGIAGRPPAERIERISISTGVFIAGYVSRCAFVPGTLRFRMLLLLLLLSRECCGCKLKG
jgi:hypothetical protein